MKLCAREQIRDLTQAYVPIRGRRVLIASMNDQNVFKEYFLKSLDLASLRKLVNEKFHKEAQTLYFMPKRKVLVEIDTDEQVKELSADSCIIAKF